MSEKGPGDTSRAAPLAVLAAVAAYGLFVILAEVLIEGWLRGSPLRWWITGIVLGYAAVTLLAWRRIGRGVKAGLSALVLLALLAVSAWRLGSASAAGGVTVVALSAGTLASVVMAGALALSTALLAMVRGLPRAGQIGVVVFGLYCLAPYIAGLITRQPFAGIQRGEAFLPWMPYWLSGAALGTFGLLSLGVGAAVYHLLHATGERRMREAQRWAFTGVAMALSLLLALPDGLGRGSIAASPADGRFPSVGYKPPVPVRVVKSGAPLASRISTVVERVEALDALIDRSEFEVPALARRLPNSVDEIVAFVRESIAYEPYEGVLRGSTGALMARAGNAYDKSLLLADLLKNKGFHVRFVRATLSEAAAEILYREVFRPTTPRTPRVDEAQIARSAGMSSEEARRYLTALAPYVQEGVDTRRLIESSVRDLQNLIGPVRQGLQAAPARPRILGVIRDHIWVQVEEGGRWRDLEVSFRDGLPVQALAEPPQVLDALPESQAWEFTLQLALTYSRGGQRGTRTITDWAGPVSRLLTSQIILAIAPADAEAGPYTSERFERAERFASAIVVNGTAQAGAIFDLRGEVEGGGPGGRIGDILSGKGTARDPSVSTSEPGLLESLHVTYTTVSPSGVRDERRRLLYAAPPGADDPADLAATKFRIIGSHWIQVYGGRIAPLFIMHRLARLLLENREVLEMATGERPAPPVEELAGLLAKIHTDPIQLLVFASLSTLSHVEARDRRNVWRLYLSQPNVVVYKSQGLERRGDSYRFEEGFDVVHDPVEVLSRDGSGDPQAFDLRLRRGAFLTGLELALHRDRARAVSAQIVLEKARMDHIPVRVLTSSSMGELAKVPLSPFDRSSIEAALSRGEIVVLPERRVVVDGRERMGWMRVDAAGHALGIMEGGGGQTSVERTLVIVFLVGGGVNALFAYLFGCGGGLMSGVTPRLTGAECLAYVACNFVFGGIIAVLVFLSLGDEAGLANAAFETYVVTGTLFTSEILLYGVMNATGAYATEWFCQGLTGQGWGPPLFR